MSNIYEQLLYTTLRIECMDEESNLLSIGTGFLLQRPVGTDKYKLYLVSNKHVLFGTDSIAIAFTKMKGNEADLGNILRLPIKNLKENVVPHPNPDVDIAVLECTGLFVIMPEQLYFKAVSYDMLATFDEPELSVAENVYFVGYPDNRYDIKNNLPLIRTGLIASHPKINYNGNEIFIIDAQVFPGSSGSPVYIDLTYENIRNGQIVLGKNDIKLLGIVSSTMIRNNKLKSINTGTQLLTEEVLGLGIVYKATAIKELIDSMPTNN
ncbi:trypsin-like peptidase [Breznakia blatticola]|uniref:Trypsin-like peptidase n=1 Tax=Breznakia blatticola TaxID=1754012 RepID=A0A4R8A5U2_9FIRM|nr:serine protease [Breznakia blatticola]TDW26013.1 trypsin-like peptidase [Breznakia blatticola]